MLNGPVIDCVWSVDRAHQLFNGLYEAFYFYSHVSVFKIRFLDVPVGDCLPAIVEFEEQVRDVRKSMLRM